MKKEESIETTSDHIQYRWLIQLFFLFTLSSYDGGNSLGSGALGIKTVWGWFADAYPVSDGAVKPPAPLLFEAYPEYPFIPGYGGGRSVIKTEFAGGCSGNTFVGGIHPPYPLGSALYAGGGAAYQALSGGVYGGGYCTPLAWVAARRFDYVCIEKHAYFNLLIIYCSYWFWAEILPICAAFNMAVPKSEIFFKSQ